MDASFRRKVHLFLTFGLALAAQSISSISFLPRGGAVQKDPNEILSRSKRQEVVILNQSGACEEAAASLSSRGGGRSFRQKIGLQR
jgi:hypothetical protein